MESYNSPTVLCLEAGGRDLLASPLHAPIAIAYAGGGEHAARYAGVIPGAGWPAGHPLGALADAGNASRNGMLVAQALVEAGIEFDVVDVERTSLARYPTVILPSLRILSRLAQEALAAYAGRLLAAGDLPEVDDALEPCALLHDLARLEVASLDVPRSARTSAPGLDAVCRVGERRRYLTLVNRGKQAWEGVVTLVDGSTVAVRLGAATVGWAAIEAGAVVAAMLGGDRARIGDVTLDRGHAAAALIDGAWQVVAGDPCTVTIPTAAGQPAWRLRFDGAVTFEGRVPPDGAVRWRGWDDEGRTERLIVGPRPEATEADRFRERSGLAAEREARALAERAAAIDDDDARALASALVPLQPWTVVGACLPRFRSRLLARTAVPGMADLLPSLASLARRLGDLSLREQ